MQNMCLKNLGQMIYEHCGINYLDDLHSLEFKVSRRLSQLGISLWGYLEYLKDHHTEWDDLVECITINETYFFREETQINELCDVILPKWKEKPSIRLWSAACSTGEEPYTLAMMMAERGNIPLGRVEIVGTDINKKVLHHAHHGYYHKNSLCFRRTPQDMLDKYFKTFQDGYQVKEFIRNRVDFRFLNLIDDHHHNKMDNVDIIFCRNVLIYFDDQTTRRVINYFYNCLNPGGYLFLGHAETILGIDCGFDTINSQKTFYYRKKEQAVQST